MSALADGAPVVPIGAAEAAVESADEVLEKFHPAVRVWFKSSFGQPTAPQVQGWSAIARGESTLILAPTGSGKTLAAFLFCLNRLLFEPQPETARRCRILYVSPIKALAVDIERNLRAPLIGIARVAEGRGAAFSMPEIRIRTGDTTQRERAQFLRRPSDILITTPESLYLLLTSSARNLLSGVDTVIIDEIHTLVSSKRGSHLMLSLERLAALCGRPLQRIGLSATARPFDEVAHFLGGAVVPPESESAAATESESLSEPDGGAPLVRFRPVTIVSTAPRRRLDLKIQVPVEDMGRLANFEDIPSGSAAQGPRRPTIWTALQPQLLALIRAHQTTLLFVNSRRVAERLAAALNELAAEEARDAELLVDAPLGAAGSGLPGLAVVRAHHGSLAYKQRQEIEDQLKLGQLRALVATSSLELGIDMGTVDLVIQIESPPSVASGLQRIGRASHQVGGTAKGIIFPRFRADLLACAAAARSMREGRVEATRYPRSPLDVLAQQMVAVVATEPQRAETLYRLVRGAAPFAELSRATFDGVLDLLTGRYPSDEFADLRPRLTWDRATGRLTPREGALRLAVLNGGTIPDRGLYGVFLAGERAANSRHSMRVGELDEEMVFESRPGDTFMLGATTWRIQEITHDRVLVTPAPGEPGKMPFWRGDAPGRPLEFGEEIGRLCRELRELPPAAAQSKLTASHDLDDQAAVNLLRYLDEQIAATRVLPDDQNIVIERYRDELGDLRLCVLTPLGGRVHAPWCLAVVAKLRARLGYDPESMWTDDGFVIRLPENEALPDSDMLLPAPEEVEALVMQQLGGSALLAAKFREAAARALLLPRRKPGTRAPLWHQRKRAFDLLKVAAQYPGFPILLEAYRECLRDVFDLPALLAVLRRVRRRELHVTTIDTQKPSPFAAALLFSYVAQYIYQGDAPLAERRAQALAIDLDQLRELLGSTDLRELLDAVAIEETEAQLQGLPSLESTSEAPDSSGPDPDAADAPKPEAKSWLFLRSADGLHDLLLRVGDLTEAEIARRCTPGDQAAQATKLVRELLAARRIARVQVAGESRYIAVEDAARYRDALGVPLPGGLPESLLTAPIDPLTGLCRRYARTHGPFTVHELAQRFALPPTTVEPLLRRLCEDGRLIEGEFRPQGLHREFCDAEVLQKIRRKSLAKLRREVEPAPAHALGRLYTHWQGVLRPRRGLDALLDTIQSLQGAPLVASTLESEILAARVSNYSPSDLDTLIAAGEIGWVGLAPLGEHDGRLMLGLSDQLATLLPPPDPARRGDSDLTPAARAILEQLRRHGASFFLALHEAAGGGFTGDTVRTLWDLVWQGLITNDTFAVLRALQRGERSHGQHAIGRGAGAGTLLAAQGFRTRRTSCPPSAQGRWVLVRPVDEGRAELGAATGVAVAASDAASRGAALCAAQAQQLLSRYGVLTREAVLAEDIMGGFGAIYPALKALEDSGRVRRGLLVAGLGATQFALPPALDLLRTLREEPPEPEVVRLSAVDPANPYGAALRWPVPLDDRPANDKTLANEDAAKNGAARTLSRTAGSSVILVDGALAAYLRRRSPDLVLFLPADEPARSRVARAVARKLAERGPAGLPQPRRSLFTIATVNQVDANKHPFASALTEAGFFGGVGIAGGYRLRAAPPRLTPGRSFSDADYARYQSAPLPDAEQELDDDPEVVVDEESADQLDVGGDDA